MLSQKNIKVSQYSSEFSHEKLSFIVSFQKKKTWWIFPSFFCVTFTRPGKPSFSYGFSYDFPIVLWFSYGFPMVFLWFSYGFPMVFLWFSYGFPMVFPRLIQPGRGVWTAEIRSIQLHLMATSHHHLQRIERTKGTCRKAMVTLISLGKPGYVYII